MKPIFHQLVVKEIRQETSESVSISFDIPFEVKEHYRFKPGQYLTIKYFHEGIELRRSYSICSAPFENELRVAVKKIENGLFSNFANDILKQGDVLDVMSPMGHFLLPEKRSNQEFCFFAVGSGITPILSMIKSVLNDSNSDVILFYGNKQFSSIIFREQLEALKNKFMDRFRVIHILSRESVGNPLQKGRLDSVKTLKLISAFIDVSRLEGVFICGPEFVIHTVKDSFISSGLDLSKIHFELFGTAIPISKVEKEIESIVISSLVTVIVDGETLDIPLASNDINVLDAALAAGADLPFACKGGVCCTCKAKIIEGSARMDVNYALEQDEVAAGYILTCQSHPTSLKLIVSFDE